MAFQHLPRLRALLSNNRCPVGDVDDVVQEAALRYWSAAAPPERSWLSERLLFGVALNVLRERRRLAWRRAGHLGRYGAASQVRHSDEREACDRRLDVRDAVCRLPPALRRAVFLVYWRGLSLGDAAAVAGCTRAVFRRHLTAARRQLAGLLVPGPRSGRPVMAGGVCPVPRIFPRTPGPLGPFTDGPQA